MYDYKDMKVGRKVVHFCNGIVNTGLGGVEGGGGGGFVYHCKDILLNC